MADVVRSYVGGNFFFNLDGVKCGFIKKLSGGAISAEVINEAVGPDYFVRKHIGQPKYEDISLDIGFSMSKAVYDWIAASWQMNYQRKNGAILACDYKLEAKSERQFFNALITETTIPAMDGSSKEPAYLTLKFSPEYTRQMKASGKASGDYSKNEQKMFLPSNFKLEIDGLDCTKVARIASFTVKQTIAQDSIGDARDYLQEPGKLEFPNLKISLSEVSAQPWRDWFEDFVIKGNNDEGKEKGGKLTFLSPNRLKELARIKFFHLGIFKLAEDGSTSNHDSIHRLTAELYCERMEFVGPASPAA